MIREAIAHDSAALHVSGEARYIDDLPEPPGTLYAAIGPSTEAHAKVLAAGHPTPLWTVPGTPEDRTAFAGEAAGLWLWAVVWPEQTGLLMYDEMVLTDLRDAGAEVDLVPCGALSPRLLS